MAAARLNLPAMLLTGGPMKSNIVNGEKYHPIQGTNVARSMRLIHGSLGNRFT